MPRIMKKIETGTVAGIDGSAKTPVHRRLIVIAAVVFTSLLTATAHRAQAQNKLGPAAPVTYDNKFEVYGGLNYMNFMAGQALPKRMNLGGGEFEGTYWLTHKWGLALEYRGEAGTTQVYPNALAAYGVHRPLVYMNMGMAGAQYRWWGNQHAAVDVHGYGGIADGVFDAGTAGAQIGPGAPSGFSPAYIASQVGLYPNKTAPIFALGGSLDFNRSKDIAIRLSPDLILEHFGTETREFFAISGGVVYRFPVRKKK
jgi:hypothetical protein